MNAYSKTALATAITAALTACSSGSTSNDNSDPNADNNSSAQPQAVTVERVSLTGLAVKGTVLNAKAELFKIENGQVADQPLATGSTDGEGRYSLLGLSSTPYNGPALIKVTHKPGAKMVCDSTSGCSGTQLAQDDTNNDVNSIIFGETFELPTSFEMTAIIPRINTSQAGGQVYTANISSLTHASAQYVVSQNEISETLVRRLNNRIRTMFGLDGSVNLLQTQPTDPTNNGITADQAALYGSLTAALAQIAGERTPQVSVDVILDEFVDSLSAEGQLLWNNDSNTSDISIDAILSAAQTIIAEMRSNSSSDFGQIEGTITLGITNANNQTGFTEINPPTAIPPANQKITVGNQVVLKGDSDQEGVSYQWRKISGPDVTLSGDTTDTLSFTPTRAGQYEFSFMVASQSDASQTGSARVTVTAEAEPGAASLVAGKYSLIGATADFSVVNPGQSNRSLGLDFGTERTNGFQIKAGSGNALTLIENNIVTREWSTSQSFIAGNTYAPGAPRSAITDTLEQPDIDTSSGSSDGSIDNHGNLRIRASASSDIEDDRVDYSFARNVDLLKIAPGAYISTDINQENEYGITSNNQPDFADTRRSTTIVETLILAKDDGSFTNSNVQPDYGVISIELASDESYGQAIASELQHWDVNASGDNFNLQRTTDSDSNKIGRVVSRFSAGLRFDGNGYTLITDPSQRNSIVSAKDPSGEANDSDPLSAVFASSGSPLFNIPPVLLNEALKDYDKSSAIFEGLFTPQGEMINVNLMLKGSLGQFNGADVATQILNRNIGVAIDSADPGNIIGEYRLSGIEYGIRKGRPGVQTSALRGLLILNNNTATYGVRSDDVSLNTDSTFFGVNVAAESNRGSLNVTTAANGRIVLTDQEDGTKLEGFISQDKKRMVLRIISQETLDSTDPQNPQSEEARHGYIVATLVEEQAAQ